MELIKDRVEVLRKDLDDSRNNQDGLKDAIADIRNEVALVRQQLADQIKRIDEWDRRWWGLIIVLLGALLSLASGVIVTLVRH